MNLQLNYHHLRYFLAVANHGGIKSASDAVHVSAPTLSAQVRELEAALGATLFHREGRRMELTRTGRIVRRYAERVFAFGDEMVEVVARGGGESVETVFLGIADSVPKLLASRLLSRAWEALPGLRIVIREGLPSELFPALANHQVDLVLANEQVPATLRSVLFSKRAGRFGVRFAATESLRKRYRPASGLDGFPVLVPTRESPLRRELERSWAEAGVKPEIRAEFDDAAAMFELAAAGVGAAPVVDAVMGDVKSRYDLVELPFRTGIHEELHVATAEREFSLPGPRLIARLAESISKT